MAHFILTGNKPDDKQHFAYDRFAREAEIRKRYPWGVPGQANKPKWFPRERAKVALGKNV